MLEPMAENWPSLLKHAVPPAGFEPVGVILANIQPEQYICCVPTCFSLPRFALFAQSATVYTGLEG
jgi:hypothetical protein